MLILPNLSMFDRSLYVHTLFVIVQQFEFENKTRKSQGGDLNLRRFHYENHENVLLKICEFPEREKERERDKGEG